METIPSHYDNEINLFELIKTIWDGKLWVIIATLMSTGLGVAYTKVVPTVYRVQVHAAIHADAEAKILGLVAHHSIFDWRHNKRSSNFFLETKKLEDSSVYLKDLESARAIMNSIWMQSKKDELEQISKLSPVLLGTEAVATRVLSNQRFLYSFETMGLEPVKFSEPETKIKSPNTSRVVALAFVLGGMIGVLSVLIRSAYRNRIQNQ